MGFPTVNVPVLSKTTVVTSFIFWIAAPLRIRIPFSAPLPLPTINAVGVANPNAHGQAITNTATAEKIAIVEFVTSKFTQGKKSTNRAVPLRIISGNTLQAKKVKIAKAKTVGTKMAVTRSANACIGTFVVCASSTSLAICETKVSLPIFFASTLNDPSILMVAPITLSPTVLFVGIDSPVAIDSSTAPSPFIIIPSVGIFSPALTIMISPTIISETEISISSLSFRSTAFFAPKDMRRLIASDDLPRALTSIYRPVR